MTPKAREALEWFLANGPIGWFDASAPSAAMRRRLLAAGLIQETDEPRKTLQVIRFEISSQGRAALACDEAF